MVEVPHQSMHSLCPTLACVPDGQFASGGLVHPQATRSANLTAAVLRLLLILLVGGGKSNGEASWVGVLGGKIRIKCTVLSISDPRSCLYEPKSQNPGFQ
jgi:hypothetical protein